MNKKQRYLIGGISIVVIVFVCIGIWGIRSRKMDPKEEFSKIIAFGDSYSDNGQAKKISTEIVESELGIEEAYIKPSEDLYWNGRYSNGKTAVEVMAEACELPLMNYATGGATTGLSNYSFWMDVYVNTGVLGQIEQFEKSLGDNKADDKALYFIFASANDYFYLKDYEVDDEIQNVAQTAIDNIKFAIEKLSSLGAKHFFIVNSSDLSMVPYEITMGRTQDAKKFTKYINDRLPAVVEKLETTTKSDIVLFDITKVSDEIVNHPSEYGMKVLDTACETTYPEKEAPKAEEDTYYFWDEWHYTKVVHKIVGEAMYRELIK